MSGYRFVNINGVGRWIRDAEWNEADHPRDKDGKFSHAIAAYAASISNKQLKREHAARSLEEFYGPEISGAGLKGRRAILKMLEERRGHIKAAFHRKDIGDIDLVWGDEIAGLKHCIRRRTLKGQDLQKVISGISSTIENGAIEPDFTNERGWAIRYKNLRVSVSNGFKGSDSKRMVITGYEVV